MPQLEYWPIDEWPERPAHPQYYTDPTGKPWRLVAVIIHRDRDSDRITKQIAFLRPVSGGGGEWETALEDLTDKAGKR
ncbi:hypothetical protein ABZ404_38605 [Streptomyces sp. NPDC005878]|uniref:hypothetical protein n=1 Tax=Streptomyces sp. NPDC005878 TaxID=3157077 RepID=UPI0033D849B1